MRFIHNNKIKLIFKMSIFPTLSITFPRKHPKRCKQNINLIINSFISMKNSKRKSLSKNSSKLFQRLFQNILIMAQKQHPRFFYIPRFLIKKSQGTKSSNNTFTKSSSHHSKSSTLNKKRLPNINMSLFLVIIHLNLHKTPPKLILSPKPHQKINQHISQTNQYQNNYKFPK